MKKQSCSLPIKVGNYHEVIEDVGPIPQGIYRLAHKDEFGLIFDAGKKISFGIMGNWHSKVRPVSQQYARLHRTSPTQFVDRYYKLMDELSRTPKPPLASDTTTMCFLDPSMAREVH